MMTGRQTCGWKWKKNICRQKKYHRNIDVKYNLKQTHTATTNKHSRVTFVRMEEEKKKTANAALKRPLFIFSEMNRFD